MAGRGQGAPTHTTGRPCRKCGADEWRKRGDTGVMVCAVCHRRRSRTYWTELNPAEYLWRKARDRAAMKGIPFTIAREDVEAAWPADGRCPVLGLVLRRNMGKCGGADDSPSLDRIVSAWGYEPGNIVVMSHRANQLKNNGTVAEFERLVEWMRAHGL